MSITIKDVAKVAGVSYSTVSKALRDSPLVQEKTKRKISEIAEELGYQPNVVARSLVSKKSYTVGVIWPTIERVAPSALITIINDQLEKHSYSALLSINKIETAIQTFNRFQVDAILIFNDRSHNLSHQSALKSNVPILCYGIANQLPYPTVDVNRKLAVKLAVQHLKNLGHKNITFIGDLTKNDPLQEEKVIGFTQEIDSNEKSLVGTVVGTNGLDVHDGYLAMKSLLQKRSLPTAIISSSYDITTGIMRAISETNLIIPQDLSLISYDIIPQRDQVDIDVTIVGVPLSKITDHIIEALLKIIDGQHVETTMMLEPELRITNSCAPPKK